MYILTILPADLTPKANTAAILKTQLPCNFTRLDKRAILSACIAFTPLNSGSVERRFSCCLNPTCLVLSGQHCLFPGTNQLVYCTHQQKLWQKCFKYRDKYQYEFQFYAATDVFLIDTSYGYTE